MPAKTNLEEHIDVRFGVKSMISTNQFHVSEQHSDRFHIMKQLLCTRLPTGKEQNGALFSGVTPAEWTRKGKG
ncbi:hypothetical protein M0802_015066 [Mischocyttarus mexicanus]|nr:hypothetical protein M0802_015066 [Mischocyttarus mexicanus]